MVGGANYEERGSENGTPDSDTPCPRPYPLVKE